MGKVKKKTKQPTCSKGFTLEESGFDEGSEEGLDPDLGLGEGSCLCSQPPFTSDSAPIPKLRKVGVLPPIWHKIVDSEHHGSRKFKLIVEEAMREGQEALDIVLKKFVDLNGLDLEELERTFEVEVQMEPWRNRNVESCTPPRSLDSRGRTLESNPLDGPLDSVAAPVRSCDRGNLSQATELSPYSRSELLKTPSQFLSEAGKCDIQASPLSDLSGTDLIAAASFAEAGFAADASTAGHPIVWINPDAVDCNITSADALHTATDEVAPSIAVDAVAGVVVNVVANESLPTTADVDVVVADVNAAVIAAVTEAGIAADVANADVMNPCFVVGSDGVLNTTTETHPADIVVAAAAAPNAEETVTVEKISTTASAMYGIDKGQHASVVTDVSGKQQKPHLASSFNPEKPQDKAPRFVTAGNRYISEELRLNILSNVPKDIYKFSAEEVADVEEEWNATLIGMIIGGRLPFNYVKDFMETHWKIPQPKLFVKDNGVMVFKFNSVEDRLWVLKNGPWLMAGNRPLIVKEWCTGMPIDWTSFQSIPVWAKVLDIDPMFLSSSHMLDVIGNMIGKPLSKDRITNEVSCPMPVS